MTQVIGKKLRLMNVPAVAVGEQVEQLVITPEGRVRKQNGEAFSLMFRLTNDSYGIVYTVGLTASDVAFLVSNSLNQGGNTVIKRSNVINGNYQDATFFYDFFQNKIICLNINSNGDVATDCVLIANQPPYLETFWSISKGNTYSQYELTVRGDIEYAFSRTSVGIYEGIIQASDNYGTMFLIGGAPGVKVIKTGDKTFTIETRDEQGVLSNDVLDNFGLIIRIY